MCGIVGFCGEGGSFGQDELGRMLAAIEHRGPDDSGTFFERLRTQPSSGVWLGSRRLAIQDLSPGGHQPMVDPGIGNAIAFNGEIYNFKQLRADLQARGHRFHSQCDTEVALRSWCAGGLEAVKGWRGMYAAALWDREQQRLTLVRDQWGIKPLYYTFDGQRLAFTSELRALLDVGLVPRKLSRRGVRDYLRYGSLQDPVTIIDGVYALLPGHALHWCRGRIRLERFQELPAETDEREQRTEQILRESVRLQLVSDVPVVVFLSGGVDSSVVSLLARQEANAPVDTMSIAFEEASYSERDYASRVARHLGTRHHEVMLSGTDALGKAIDAISMMDQPTVDGVNVSVISEAARRLGFTVALSGLGGDELFGGYSTFQRTPRLARILEVGHRHPRLSTLFGETAAPFLQPLGAAGRKFAQYLQHGDWNEHPYFLQRTIFYPSQIDRLCGPSEASSREDEAADERYRWLLEQAESFDPLNRISFLECCVYMGNTLLRDSDQMSMAHSLELRVPMVDQVLVRDLLSRPGGSKQLGSGSKAWLRQAFGKYLLPEVFTRKKMGFTFPFDVWLRGPLASEVGAVLAGGTAGLLEPDAVQRVWRGFQHRQVDWTRPWSLYVLNQWVKRNIGQSLSEDRDAVFASG